MFGYIGKILRIDMTAGKVKADNLKEEFCREFIGGSGFIAKLLLDETTPGYSPLSAGSPLIFATGAFAGTLVPTGNKYTVGAKSPLTGFIGDAVSSSFWPQQLKQAGWDAIVVTGRAEKPTWMLIDDDHISFRDGSHLWGHSTFDVEQIIRQEIGDDRVSVATIGQGGENMVPYACIWNDWRQAGRSGVGAVMGSKKLKAIAVRGTESVEVAHLEDLRKSPNNTTRRFKPNQALRDTDDMVQILTSLS